MTKRSWVQIPQLLNFSREPAALKIQCYITLIKLRNGAKITLAMLPRVLEAPCKTSPHRFQLQSKEDRTHYLGSRTDHGGSFTSGSFLTKENNKTLFYFCFICRWREKNWLTRFLVKWTSCMSAAFHRLRWKINRKPDNKRTHVRWQKWLPRHFFLLRTLFKNSLRVAVSSHFK